MTASPVLVEGAPWPLAEAALDALPFRSRLSFEPLIAFWLDVYVQGPTRSRIAATLRSELERVPELRGPVDDLALLERDRDLVELLMTAAVPAATWEQAYVAALVPFELRVAYATPLFRRTFMDAEGQLRVRASVSPHLFALGRVLAAYRLILDRLYGLELELDDRVVFTAADPETGLERHFQIEFDTRFVEVVPAGALPPLPAGAAERLRRNFVDVDFLRELLPPERFELRGFTLLRAVDVTDQEVLSSLKRDLIDRASILSTERFASLEAKLRTFFRRPALHVGLAALEGERVLLLRCGDRLESACIFSDSTHRRLAEFAGSVFQRAVLERRPVLVHDLAALPSRTPVEDDHLRCGARTLVVAPLLYQERVIGTLDLSSPEPGALTPSHLPKLLEITPLFAMAVQRALDEFNSRVQAVLKEQCTAIHPSVEWRFRRAVLDALERRRGGETAPVELEPIVFAGVYPLYALSDIRGSSAHRALAIQADLLTQLRLAGAVLEAAYAARRFPAVDELRYRLGRELARAARELGSGDEVGVLTFLRQDVEPLFEHLAGFGPGVRAAVEAYRAALDPIRGAVYHHRRQFEESVTRLTETMAAYLDQEEQAAQVMCPHYFEKQKTDGVEHQIFVGASLREDGTFDPLGLKNLRLWQLMVVCGLALRAEQLRPQLPLPLETAHLILVHHAPLAIRFRFDEKRFDVDGAYDVRYELLKKRLDKAVVRSTGERVTQPGRIAIVYAQPAEGQEYRAYVEYLQSLGLLLDRVEDLELDELQGVRGLRAFRVEVNVDRPVSSPAVTVLRSLTATPQR
jgi:hypothetical protein